MKPEELIVDTPIELTEAKFRKAISECNLFHREEKGRFYVKLADGRYRQRLLKIINA